MKKFIFLILFSIFYDEIIDLFSTVNNSKMFCSKYNKAELYCDHRCIFTVLIMKIRLVLSKIL